MATPRQRRKVRSTHKAVRQYRRTNERLKKAPPLSGPLASQKGWDRKKTVRENYASLGLADRLDAREENKAEKVERGRILRDPNGAVVGFELEDENKEDEALMEPVPDQRFLPADGPKRHASAGEIAMLTRLLSAHGKDLEAMARDRSRNPMQLTAGQLRRGLRKAGLLPEIA